VRDEQVKGLQEAEEKIKNTIKDIEKLPKRDKSEEMKKKRADLAQLLEDLEEDKLYYTFNIEHVEEVLARSLSLSVSVSLYLSVSLILSPILSLRLSLSLSVSLPPSLSRLHAWGHVMLFAVTYMIVLAAHT